MTRKVYIAKDELSLAEYCPAIDDKLHYECWQDPATQDGYNYKMHDSFEEFCNRPIRSRLLAVIIRNTDNTPLGIVSLSPEGSPPDLAIMLYKPYRGKGYGRNAFDLAAKYCMETFELECIYAGCYETNVICGLSSQVQHFSRKDFKWSFPTEAFARTVIKLISKLAKQILGKRDFVCALWNVLP